MKKIFTLILVFCFSYSHAQTDYLYHGNFNKSNKRLMSSNRYQPDDWERPYYENAIKTVFPSDLVKHPEAYANKLIHLIGVVDSVYIGEDNSVNVLLDNKYWDYIEDYSIQDEVLFVSEKGDGKFLLNFPELNLEQIELVKRFPEEKKLFLVYAIFKESSNSYPVLIAEKVKYIDYEFYTTNIFSYEIMRTKKGEVATDKNGKIQMKNFKFLRVAKAGQNK